MMYPLCGYDVCLAANDAPPRRNDVFVLAGQILRVASLRIVSGHGKPCPYGNSFKPRPSVELWRTDLYITTRGADCACRVHGS